MVKKVLEFVKRLEKIVIVLPHEGDVQQINALRKWLEELELQFQDNEKSFWFIISKCDSDKDQSVITRDMQGQVRQVFGKPITHIEAVGDLHIPNPYKNVLGNIEK